MNCKPEMIRSVPLFGRWDDDETAVLASQVSKTFGPRQRIYKIGEVGDQASACDPSTKSARMGEGFSTAI
jgi:hypothetical protein